jgi:hypothetical protein
MLPWFFRPFICHLFDSILRGLFVLRPFQSLIKKRLQAEMEIFLPQEADAKSREYSSAVDDRGPISGPQLVKEVDRMTRLMEINHQRVSASISHVSIMSAILLFFLRTSFDCNPTSRLFVSVELCAYLWIIVALLRCLRDFGIDKDYDPKSKVYRDDLLGELSFRYGLLRACNVVLIFGTILIFFLFVFHLLPSGVHRSIYHAVFGDPPGSCEISKPGIWLSSLWN